MSKVLLILLISLLSAIFLIYYNTEHDWETSSTQSINQGELISSKISNFFFAFANYTLTFDQSLNYLSIISHQSHLFSNKPGHSFFYCAASQTSNQNHFGMFTFNDQYIRICKDQVIDKITQISSDEVEITGYFSDCELLAKYKFSIKQTDEKLQISGECLNSMFNRSLVVMSSNNKENVYGFGEHSAKVNLKGEIISNFVRESGLFKSYGFLPFIADLFGNHSAGKDYYSYYPAPLFLTSDLRGCFLLNDNYNIFDMTKPDVIKMMVWSPKISMFLFDGLDFPTLITKLTDLTGRMKPLPEWIMNGAVVAITGGGEILHSSYERLKKFNSSLAGIWTQDWSGKRMDGEFARLWWNWQLDEDYYPEWKTMTEELNKNGVRRLTYINPMLHNITGYLNHVTNFFQIAAEKDFLIKDSQNNFIYYDLNGFKAGLMDFTNPQAVEFYKQIIKDYMFNDSKTSGFMADFGEDIPLENIVFYNKFAETDAMHNIYPYYLPKICSEAAQEFYGSNDEIVFFTRSGNKLTPNYTRLVWAGDQLENWDGGNGIKSGLKAMLNLGLSGAQLSHTDVGGYIDFSFHGFFNIERTEELLFRWIELGAFSVVMRTHEGTGPEKTPQAYSSDKIAEFFSKFTKIYLSWKEYRIFLMKEGYENGLPVLRHMMIHYLHDPVAQTLIEQYLLGEDLLVAPVFEQGSEMKEVYFPYARNGEVEEWIHLWSGNKYESCGCWKEIPAPLGKPAVFYKKESKWGKKMVEFLDGIEDFHK